MKYKNITFKVVCVLGLIASAYGIFREGARSGVYWMENREYKEDTDMRNFMDRTENCGKPPIVDLDTDSLEKGYCISKDDWRRTRLFYSRETPWGFVTTSELENGKPN